MHPASDDPHTREVLDAHQAGALRWLAGGAIAVVLGVLLGVALASLAGSSGTRFPGAGLLVVILVSVGTVGLVAGLGALQRTVRWRRALATTPWQTGQLRIAGPAVMAFEPAGSFELDPEDRRVHMRLLSTAVWRTRAVQRLDGAEVRAAPVGGGQWVLTADGLGSLYGAREVRTQR